MNLSVSQVFGLASKKFLKLFVEKNAFPAFAKVAAVKINHYCIIIFMTAILVIDKNVLRQARV